MFCCAPCCGRWHSMFCRIWSRGTWREHHRLVTTGTFWLKTTCCGVRNAVKRVWLTRSCGVVVWHVVELTAASPRRRRMLPWKPRGRMSTRDRRWLKTTGVGLHSSRRRFDFYLCPAHLLTTRRVCLLARYIQAAETP